MCRVCVMLGERHCDGMRTTAGYTFRAKPRAQGHLLLFSRFYVTNASSQRVQSTLLRVQLWCPLLGGHCYAPPPPPARHAAAAPSSPPPATQPLLLLFPPVHTTTITPSTMSVAETNGDEPRRGSRQRKQPERFEPVSGRWAGGSGANAAGGNRRDDDDEVSWHWEKRADSSPRPATTSLPSAESARRTASPKSPKLKSTNQGRQPPTSPRPMQRL